MLYERMGLVGSRESVETEPSWQRLFTPLYQNASMTWVRQKSWSSLSATVKEIRCTGPFRSDYQSDCTRFIVMLDAIGGRSNLRTNPSRSTPVLIDSLHQMSIVPANAPIYAHSDELRYMRHITFTFQTDVIKTILDENELDIRGLETSRFMFFEPSLLHLARAFEVECESEEPTDILYGDSLSLALLSKLCRLKNHRRTAINSSKLTSRQMRRVMDYLFARLSHPVSLIELSTVANLSRSHFARAFRNSTGLPPHQWLLRQRVRKVQELLLAGGIPLSQIAVATGFSDQSHLTRVFTRIVGESPAAWLRDRST
jgi:AraC family transcriptional regulator